MHTVVFVSSHTVFVLIRTTIKSGCSYQAVTVFFKYPIVGYDVTSLFLSQRFFFQHTSSRSFFTFLDQVENFSACEGAIRASDISHGDNGTHWDPCEERLGLRKHPGRKLFGAGALTKDGFGEKR